MDSINVISIDPGETTGYAIGKIANDYMEVKADQEKFDHLGIYKWLTEQHPHIIVCESFDFRKRAQGVNMYPRELIGVINLFVQSNSFVHSFYMQKPAEGKSYYDDNKLREADLYWVGKDHARDATRHLLQWFTFGAGYKYNKKGFGPCIT